MEAQSHCEHAGTEAYVVVDPVRRTAVLVQPRYMRADPYADVRNRIGIAGHCIGSVFIDRRCPIDRQATQDEAQKDWHVQPMTAPHQQVVSAYYTHTGLILRHACS